MNVKMLFSPDDGRILGAQIVGTDGVDKRIDALATAISAGMTVQELTHLELGYVPPYGSAKEVLNIAGYVDIDSNWPLANAQPLGGLLHA